MVELGTFGSDDVFAIVTDWQEGQTLLDLLIKYSVEKDETYRFTTPDNEKEADMLNTFLSNHIGIAGFRRNFWSKQVQIWSGYYSKVLDAIQSAVTEKKYNITKDMVEFFKEDATIGMPIGADLIAALQLYAREHAFYYLNKEVVKTSLGTFTTYTLEYYRDAYSAECGHIESKKLLLSICIKNDCLFMVRY